MSHKEICVCYLNVKLCSRVRMGMTVDAYFIPYVLLHTRPHHQLQPLFYIINCIFTGVHVRTTKVTGFHSPSHTEAVLRLQLHCCPQRSVLFAFHAPDSVSESVFNKAGCTGINTDWPTVRNSRVQQGTGSGKHGWKTNTTKHMKMHRGVFIFGVNELSDETLNMYKCHLQARPVLFHQEVFWYVGGTQPG